MQQICHLLVHAASRAPDHVRTRAVARHTHAAPILHEREANNYLTRRLGRDADRPAALLQVARELRRHARGRARVKTIIVSRNPKDTCVSMWRHVREKPDINR